METLTKDRAKRVGVGKLAVAFVGLNLLDCALTSYFVGTGQGTELNPLMQRALEAPAIFWLIKVGGSSLLALALLKLDKVLEKHNLNRWVTVRHLFELLVVGMVGICVFNLVGIIQ